MMHVDIHSKVVALDDTARQGPSELQVGSRQTSKIQVQVVLQPLTSGS